MGKEWIETKSTNYHISLISFIFNRLLSSIVSYIFRKWRDYCVPEQLQLMARFVCNTWLTYRERPICSWRWQLPRPPPPKYCRGTTDRTRTWTGPRECRTTRGISSARERIFCCAGIAVTITQQLKIDLFGRHMDILASILTHLSKTFHILPSAILRYGNNCSIIFFLNPHFIIFR